MLEILEQTNIVQHVNYTCKGTWLISVKLLPLTTTGRLRPSPNPIIILIPIPTPILITTVKL